MLTNNSVSDDSLAESSHFDIFELVDNLADPAILVGPDRHITAANSHIDKLFGWEEIGLTGQLIDVLIPPAIGESHPDWIAAFFDRPAARSMSENPVIEGVHQNGDRVRIDVSLRPVKHNEQQLVLAIVHDNSRPADSYTQRVSELGALTAVANLTKTGLDAHDLIERLARQVRNLIPYDRFVVVTFDRMKSVARDWFVADEEFEDNNRWNDYKLSPEQVHEYLSMREPFITRSGSEHTLLSSMEANVARFKQGYRTLLCAPLIWNDEVLGVINFRSKSVTAYNDDSLKIAAQISAVAAAALGRSSLLASVSLADHHRLTIANIGRAVSRVANIRSVFDSVALQIDQIIPIDRFLLTALNSDKTGYSIEAQWGPSDPEMRIGITKKIQRTATDLATIARSPVILSKEQIQAISLRNYPNGDDPGYMGSWIATPLISEGEVVGVIHFLTSKPSMYTRVHLDYSQQISAVFTPVIQGSVSQNNNARERQIRNAVVSLNRKVIAGETLKSLAKLNSELLATFIDFDRLATVTIDAENSESTVVYLQGLEISGNVASKTTPYSGTENEGNSQRCDVDQLPEPWREQLASAGLNSWMYLALGGDSQDPIGAIWISSIRKDAFNRRDLGILERLGGVLSPAFHSEALEVASKRLESERVWAASLVTQTTILEADAKAKSEFISSISHEFKTPLTSVVAFSSLLMRDKTLDERQIKQLNLIQNNAWRLERMIDDLLHVAAVDFGGLSYDIRQVDVVNTVKDVFDSLKPVASAPKRRLVWRESTTKALAAIDPIRMAQAVQNIVSNAIKYSPIDSGITVSTYESDGSVEILVRNKGKLSKSDTELAFSRFTRLDNELTRSTLGTGLGLSITREILEAMDGSVTLESDQIHIEAKIRIPILAK